MNTSLRGNVRIIDSGFPKTVPENFPLRFFQFEFERRQFSFRQQRIGNIVLENDVTHNRTFLAGHLHDNQANPDFIAFANGGQ
jgi:hypothetical protein